VLVVAFAITRADAFRSSAVSQFIDPRLLLFVPGPGLGKIGERVLRFGGELPWEEDRDTAHVACPDPLNPLIMELRRIRE
jgi:hypothetical protein